jgi:hypothetical protein
MRDNKFKNSAMEETQEILRKMGFENPNDNVWKNEWFGYFLLTKTATPEELAEFIYRRGFNRGKEEQSNAAQATAILPHVSGSAIASAANAAMFLNMIIAGIDLGKTESLIKTHIEDAEHHFNEMKRHYR